MMTMLEFAKRAALAGVAAALVFPAAAADIQEPPPVIEAPEPAPVYEAPAEVGGWYIRGDIDYHWSDVDDIEYITYGAPGETNEFTVAELKGAMSLGAGVGYQINNYFRTDLTADYWFKAKFRGSTTGVGAPCAPAAICISDDRSSFSALLLLANAYVDLGTYHGITPYIGAGIGGAYVKWDKLRNTAGGITFEHEGSKGWRFAYAAMAGASYCLTRNVKLDAGYRFSRIEGGRMFEFASGAGPGFDDGINTHEVRAGLRYQFGGGSSDCGPAEQVAYDPPPVEPVYK
jgi:opacity protein-like surface antigen